MKKQTCKHVDRKLSESDGANIKPTGAVSGELVTELFEYNGGRRVTVYVPPDPSEAIVFAGDGQGISKWGPLLEKADVPSPMIVGVHGLTDETLRLHEYSPGFEPERFAAHDDASWCLTGGLIQQLVSCDHRHPTQSAVESMG